MSGLTKEDHDHIKQLTDTIWRQGEEIVDYRLKWLAAEAKASELEGEVARLRKLLPTG